MFKQARLRLALLNIVLFGLVLAAFSVVFYTAFATVLAPTFDLAPELTNEQAAEAAFQATLERVGISLVMGDLVVVILVAAIAWVVAGRTLRPIGEAHARQRRFVADASHEMRTPLAAIRASAESTLGGDLVATADDLRRALHVALDSANQLTVLTNDLLLLARTENHPPGRRQAVDISVVVAEAAEAFARGHPDASRPRLDLAEDIRVLADSAEIGRIVTNLLDNAVRYGGASTMAARVTTRATERDVVVEVEDAGVGIAGDDLERIFEPFHRVRSDRGAPPGNGLGLAIGRELAERNGGRLTASSRLGAGATFRLTLPRFR
jgi:signal transduction histidine kinase